MFPKLKWVPMRVDIKVRHGLWHLSMVTLTSGLLLHSRRTPRPPWLWSEARLAAIGVLYWDSHTAYSLVCKAIFCFQSHKTSRITLNSCLGSCSNFSEQELCRHVCSQRHGLRVWCPTASGLWLAETLSCHILLSITYKWCCCNCSRGQMGCL